MARADDRAVILGNEKYRYLGNIGAADKVSDTQRALEAAGFSVVNGRDMSAEQQRQAVATLMRDRASPDRSVIVLAGQFVSSASNSWLLGSDARNPDLANVDTQGLSMSTVMDIAARAPGGAILVLGLEDQDMEPGEGLLTGARNMAVPQGVTLVTGGVGDIVPFVRQQLTRPGVSIAEMAEKSPRVTVRGYINRTTPFLPVAGTTAPTSATTAAERTFWQITRGIGTAEAYQIYLDRYPRGTYAGLARAELQKLLGDAAAGPEQDEAALRLTRDQRRQVQRDLSLMGYDTRGIDGVFGRGTRAAIAGWQSASNLDRTGYLTSDQIRRLSREADRKAAELEREAAARQAEEERLDRAYWTETGGRGTEAGLRAYLRRFPDGLYADLAQERLDLIEADLRAQTAAQERAAWDRARAANSIAAYQVYLQDYPRGTFATDARERIAALDDAAAGSAARDAAERAEAALNLPPIARNLIEVRLNQMGLKPGAVDGRFDDDTRRAIRNFQKTRGLTSTGYLDQASVAQLLSGGIIKFGD